MSCQSTPDLIKVTEIFLIPSSFLVAALGAADSNLHRAAVSFLGLIISVMWQISSREALFDSGPSDSEEGEAARSRRIWILSWLPSVFVTGWFLSSIIHLALWNRPLGS